MLIDRKYRKVLKKNTASLNDFDFIINREEFLNKLIPLINKINYSRPEDCKFEGKRNPAYSYWTFYLNDRYEITIPSYKIKKERKLFWKKGFEELSLNIDVTDKYTKWTISFWSFKLKKPLENLFNFRSQMFKYGLNTLP